MCFLTLFPKIQTNVLMMLLNGSHENSENSSFSIFFICEQRHTWQLGETCGSSECRPYHWLWCCCSVCAQLAVPCKTFTYHYSGQLVVYASLAVSETPVYKLSQTVDFGAALEFLGMISLWHYRQKIMLFTMVRVIFHHLKGLVQANIDGLY